MSYDVQVFRMCTSNEHFAAEVTGNGGKYTVTFCELLPEQKNRLGYDYGWTCTCRAFQFRGTCKHITKVRPFRCGYHEQWGTGKTTPPSDPDVKVLTVPSYDGTLGPCPICGGTLVAVRCLV